MRVLSFDTGETTGYAYQDERDEYPKGLLGAGNLRGLKTLIHFLDEWQGPYPDVVVVEKYVIWGSKRGKKANIGTTPVAIRAIGVIENWCILHDIKLHIEYDSNMCALQALKTGLDPVKIGNHNETHWAYAANHGRYYLIEQGLAKEAIEINPVQMKQRNIVTSEEEYRKLFDGP